MVVLWLSLLSVISPSVAFANLRAEPRCPEPWVCESLELAVPKAAADAEEREETLHASRVRNVAIRAGYLPAKAEFRGNILYFEGLGDSMLNHGPLFTKLTEAGYRVIAFDYMGQGGSDGKMNWTRLGTIPWIGEAVWNRYAADLECFPKRTIIGWSTGGLAAYLHAAKGGADEIVMIAPGISPRPIVGAGAWNWPVNEITIESLTTDRYGITSQDPHVDPIRPNTPLKAPAFAADLLLSAARARGTKMRADVRGFVLLSGDEDTYVDAFATARAVRANAPRFSIKRYRGALHEIDNEVLDIREEAHADILRFLSDVKP